METTTALHPNLVAHEDVLKFMLGGKAYLTFKSLKTGDSFTYLVKRADTFRHSNKYWCYVLTGPNNQSDYSFIGVLYTGNMLPEFTASDKEMSKEALSIKTFEWLIKRFIERKTIPNLEVWHLGLCSKCGRPLTDPESIRLGIGPVCRAMMK